MGMENLSYKVMVKVIDWGEWEYAGKTSTRSGAEGLAEKISVKGFLFQSTYLPPHRIQEIHILEEEEG